MVMKQSKNVHTVLVIRDSSSALCSTASQLKLLLDLDPVPSAAAAHSTLNSCIFALEKATPRTYSDLHDEIASMISTVS